MNLSEIKKSDVIVDKDYALFEGNVYAISSDGNLSLTGKKVFVKGQAVDTWDVFDRCDELDARMSAHTVGFCHQEHVDDFIRKYEKKYGKPFSM